MGGRAGGGAAAQTRAPRDRRPASQPAPRAPRTRGRGLGAAAPPSPACSVVLRWRRAHASCAWAASCCACPRRPAGLPLFAEGGCLVFAAAHAHHPITLGGISAAFPGLCHHQSPSPQPGPQLHSWAPWGWGRCGVAGPEGLGALGGGQEPPTDTQETQPAPGCSPASVCCEGPLDKAWARGWGSRCWGTTRRGPVMEL